MILPDLGKCKTLKETRFARIVLQLYYSFQNDCEGRTDE